MHLRIWIGTGLNIIVWPAWGSGTTILDELPTFALVESPALMDSAVTGWAGKYCTTDYLRHNSSSEIHWVFVFLCYIIFQLYIYFCIEIHWKMFLVLQCNWGASMYYHSFLGNIPTLFNQVVPAAEFVGPRSNCTLIYISPASWVRNALYFCILYIH